MDIIDRERIEVLEEKAKLETMQRIHASSNSRNNQSEIDEAVKVAQEATRQSDIERKKYIEMQSQLELKQRSIITAESTIRAKQSELNAKLIEAESQKVYKTYIEIDFI